MGNPVFRISRFMVATINVQFMLSFRSSREDKSSKYTIVTDGHKIDGLKKYIERRGSRQKSSSLISTYAIYGCWKDRQTYICTYGFIAGSGKLQRYESKIIVICKAFIWFMLTLLSLRSRIISFYSKKLTSVQYLYK